MQRRVAVIGAGYEGLTTAAYLAERGHDVCCADIVVEKIERLSRGEVPIMEEGLDAAVRDGLASGRLGFVLGGAAAAPGREVVFLCVDTPQLPDGSADMSRVFAAVAEIAEVLMPGAVLANKSTAPVGTCHAIARALRRPDVAVVANPEFLREGSSLEDCRHPDRIVVGADDAEAAKLVAGLFAGQDVPVVLTDPVSAEMVKYASNAFIATKLSFVNQVATLCEAVGADVAEVARAMGYDRRIGPGLLQPGPGWGGGCLPKDTRALLRTAEDAGVGFELLAASLAANAEQRARSARRIVAAAGGSVAGVTVAAWGLTFKAGTDDRRDSPAVEILRSLAGSGAVVRAYDPTVPAPDAGGNGGDLEGIELCGDPYSACEGASVLAVLTEWDELRYIDLDKVRSLMAAPCVFDARNLFEPAAMRSAGFRYHCIGRP